MQHSTGYSTRSLTQKLGFQDNAPLLLFNAPLEYQQQILHELPHLRIVTSNSDDLFEYIHFFATSIQELEERLPHLKKQLRDTGTLWISWPKLSAKTGSNLSETHVQQIGLENGLVDVKVIAVNEKWSGLKFVYRLKNRKK